MEKATTHLNLACHFCVFWRDWYSNAGEPMAGGYVVSFVHGYSNCLMLYLPASMLYVLRLSRCQMDFLGLTRQTQH
jgi:hypothetical protein